MILTKRLASILIATLTVTYTASAQPDFLFPATNDDPETNAAGNHAETLKAAQKMQKVFSDNITVSNDDLNTMEQELRNPFVSKIPESLDTIETTEPEPTVPSIEPVQQIPLPSVTIAGLVWNTDRPQAIINGIVMDIGDQIQGWTITNITKEGITIISNDNRQHLLKP